MRHRSIQMNQSQIKYIRYLFTAFIIGLTFACSTTDDPFITSSYLLEDKWKLTEVVAPSFPTTSELDTNDISVSFPKTEEYTLFLSENSCGGSYIANQDGTIEFTRTNCSEASCSTEWDFYFLTLLQKSIGFTIVDKNTLTLSIDNNNYLLFTYQNKTLTN